jgi:HNH/Endo VII superfamily nuclease toxins
MWRIAVAHGLDVCDYNLDRIEAFVRLQWGKEHLRLAKESNGIPRSAQPDKTYKPNTPDGDRLGLDHRNVVLYEYTNSSGNRIHIRHDKAASYGQGGIGDQKPHFNAGPANEKLRQHHYYEE